VSSEAYYFAEVEEEERGEGQKELERRRYGMR
jgi:hypothetical protein